MKRLIASLLVIILLFSITSTVLAQEQTPPPESHSWLIVINLDTFKLTIYDNNELYKTYPVALGRKKTPTPSGKFTILTKAKNPAWGGNGNPKRAKKGGAPDNPLGPRWLGTSAGKKPGNSIGIHGTIDPKAIGTRASGGCIRMNNKDVIEIYEFIPKKTPVWIGTTKKLEEWGIKEPV